MKIECASDITAANSCDCLVVLSINRKLGRALATLDPVLVDELTISLQPSENGSEYTGLDSYRCTSLEHKPLVLLVQFGKLESVAYKVIEEQISNVFAQIAKSGKTSIMLCWPELRSMSSSQFQHYQLLAQYCQMTTYQYQKESSTDNQQQAVKRVLFYDPVFAKNNSKQKTSLASCIQVGQSIAHGINLSKSMSDLPANTCTPGYLAEQAVKIVQSTAIKTTILDEAAMKTLNMNCVLAVSKGSNQPASFIEMHYSGVGADNHTVVLVGKGVTFDSGGYSIKSAPGMHEMKYDMCGAATVMATMQVISILKLPINVVALIPCSENLIDGQAYKPGDILTSMSGQTVEILSTDAEGRLLLADALTYAQRFEPSLIIDVATLTGAAITALGHDVSAMMSNSKTLSNQLYKAGLMSADKVWPLPLWDDYFEPLNSNFADMASSAGRSGNHGAGAILAASFLSKFITKHRWAHLDVAGTAWHRGKHLSASGRPVALLSQFLINYSNKPF